MHWSRKTSVAPFFTMTYTLQLQSVHIALLKHLHTFSFYDPVRTRVENLINERFVCQEPTSDEVNEGQPFSPVQGGFVPLDLLGEGLTHSPSLSLQQGDFSTKGILQRGKSVLLPRYSGRPS